VLLLLASEDIGKKGASVEVVVELEREGREYVALEQAVSRLSLEPSVSSVRWEVVDSTATALSTSD